MKLSGLFGGGGDGRPGETKEEQKARKEMLHYVEVNLRHGRDEKSVRESLAQAGWHKGMIEEAFSAMEKKGVLKKIRGKQENEKESKEEGKGKGKEAKDDRKNEGKRDEKPSEREKKKEDEKKMKEKETKRKEKEKESRKKEDENKKKEKEKEKGSKKKNVKFSFPHFGFPDLPGIGKKKANVSVDGKKGKRGKRKDAAKAGDEPSDDVGEASGGAAAKKRKGPSLKLPVRINIIPGGYRSWVGRQLYLSGSDTDPADVIRKIAIVCLIAGFAAAALFSRYFVYVFVGTFGAIFAFMNAMLVLSVDRRGRFVDEILPDALLLLSANIRAGYIPSRALILSARKEFGPLSDAIRKAGKEIMTGMSLEDGLRDIPKRIKSKDLERTIKLITEGIKGGGQIVTLLEENALDIRRRQAIRKEIAANIMMYAIFIAFAGCLGAPGLYALSGYLTTTMAKLTPDVGMNDQVSSKVSFINMSSGGVSGEFLFQFSIAAILITTVFGGLILGLINSGKEKDGLKFAPILAIIALGVFFAASFLVSTMFSTMMPGG